MRNAFSLVELVLVVSIIGIDAAIAISRMSRAAGSASDASLRATRRTLRAAIDSYSAEHRGRFRGRNSGPTRFWRHLTEKSNAAGNIGTTAGEHIYGPYLRARAKMPVGPNAGASGVIMTTKAVRSAVDEAQDQRGWAYDYRNGKIIANTDDLDDSDTGYVTR